MGVLNDIEPCPDFDGDPFVSAMKLTVLARNALALAEAAKMGATAFCFEWDNDAENQSTNPVRIFLGAFSFVAGATTLTVKTRSSGIATGDQLRIIRDGTAGNAFADGLISDHTLANGTQTHTVTISGAGYADGQVVEVRMYLRNAGAGATYDWGDVDIIRADISPVQLADAYPGVPTVSGTTLPTITQAQQISNAVAWLIRRVALRREPLFQAPVRRQGPFNDGATGLSQTTVRWRGGITRSQDHTTLQAQLAILQKTSGQTEAVRMFVDGTQVASQVVPSTPGEYVITLSSSLSGLSVGTDAQVTVDMVKTAPLGAPGDTSRITLYRVWTEAPSSAGDVLADQVTRTPTTIAALISWLQSLCSLITATKARLDANSHLWSRQPLYRARYGFDDYQFEVFEPGSVAIRMARAGEALVLRGRGLRVTYGPGDWEEDKFNDVGLQEFTNIFSESVLGGDTTATEVLYLDTYDGLPAGEPYLIRGVDLFYAAEWLKVVDDGE